MARFYFLTFSGKYTRKGELYANLETSFYLAMTCEYREYIKVTDLIEHVGRSTLND